MEFIQAIERITIKPRGKGVAISNGSLCCLLENEDYVESTVQKSSACLTMCFVTTFCTDLTRNS
ncbi:hypothetical protein NC652_015528 [Populus alba x Populus x berolinensis]|nr:hypothetical protein NC652_015528 [Populus alba x Populus x berolinensis]